MKFNNDFQQGKSDDFLMKEALQSGKNKTEVGKMELQFELIDLSDAMADFLEK